MSIDKDDAISFMRGETPHPTYEVVVTRDDGLTYHIARKADEIEDKADGLEWLDYEADMMLLTLQGEGVSARARIELLRDEATVVASVDLEHIVEESSASLRRRRYTMAHAHRPMLVAAKKRGAL